MGEVGVRGALMLAAGSVGLLLVCAMGYNLGGLSDGPEIQAVEEHIASLSSRIQASKRLQEQCERTERAIHLGDAAAVKESASEEASLLRQRIEFFQMSVDQMSEGVEKCERRLNALQEERSEHEKALHSMEYQNKELMENLADTNRTLVEYRAMLRTRIRALRLELGTHRNQLTEKRAKEKREKAEEEEAEEQQRALRGHDKGIGERGAEDEAGADGNGTRTAKSNLLKRMKDSLDGLAKANGTVIERLRNSTEEEDPDVSESERLRRSGLAMRRNSLPLRGNNQSLAAAAASAAEGIAEARAEFRAKKEGEAAARDPLRKMKAAEAAAAEEGEAAVRRKRKSESTDGAPPQPTKRKLKKKKASGLDGENKHEEDPVLVEEQEAKAKVKAKAKSGAEEKDSDDA